MSAQNKGSAKYTVWIAVLIVAILVGLFTTYKVLTSGLVLYSANNVIVWTLPLAAYAFFSLTSAGLALVASIPIVFGIERYMPFAKRAVVLSLATLAAAMVSMFLELGTPWHIVAFYISPNPKSSLWWLGVLYPLQLVFLAVLFRSLHAGKSGKALSLVVFLLALTISSTLGSTFGFTEARPIYYGPFMPIFFLLTAFLDGLAVFMLVTLVLYQVTKADISEKKVALYDDLGKLFGVVIGVSLVFFAWRTVMGLYAHSPEYDGIKHMIALMPYQLALWLGLVVPLIMMLIPSVRQAIWGKITAAALVVLGAFATNILIVEWGMVIPQGPRITQFPELVSPSYTVWEWLVLVFALAVSLLLYTLGEQYLKLEGND